MALPHPEITQIPTTPKPPAAPSLWNTRYTEIDENFAYVEQQIDDLTGLAAGQLGLGSNAPLANGNADAGSSALAARQDHIHPTDTSRAPLESPLLTGIPKAPTAADGTATTQIATTAFVASALSSGALLPASETISGRVELATAAETSAGEDNTRAVHPLGLKSALNATFVQASETVSGKVELATSAETIGGTDNTRAVHPAGLKDALAPKAPLVSPEFSGIPKAPNAAVGTRSTQLATMNSFETEFEKSVGLTFGWQKLPSGLVIQWGSGAAVNGGTDIAFPVAFANSCMNVIVCGGNSNGYSANSGSSPSKTKFTAFLNGGAGGSYSIRYIAVGY